jgi:hypothetical protein
MHVFASCCRDLSTASHLPHTFQPQVVRGMMSQRWMHVVKLYMMRVRESAARQLQPHVQHAQLGTGLSQVKGSLRKAEKEGLEAEFLTLYLRKDEERQLEDDGCKRREKRKLEWEQEIKYLEERAVRLACDNDTLLAKHPGLKTKVCDMCLQALLPIYGSHCVHFHARQQRVSPASSSSQH